MVIGKNHLVDGQVSFEKGVETHEAPSRVPRNQLCNLVNGQTRTDYIGPRPRWKQVALSFDSESDETAFVDGLFQGFNSYIPSTANAHLVFSVRGRLWAVDALGAGAVGELILPDANPVGLRQVWFEQAECFLIIQDNQSKPMIYDGASVRRSNIAGTGGTDADGTPLYEVPVGNVMCYSGGRLWVALPDGQSFVAGDGVFGPTGTPAYQSRDSVLRFTENTYLAGGFAFAVPSNLGPITAMRALGNLDTSLGQGPMQVFTPSGSFSIQAPLDRALWATTSDPIKTVSLMQYGFLAQASTVNVNGDLWGRALNGIRSFMIARRDFGSWANRAMSHEVGKWLERDDVNLLRYGSAATFDDRLLETVGPRYEMDHGTCHSGLVALDFHPITAVAQVEQPTWDGMWRAEWGDILQIHSFTFRGIEYCFAAVLSAADVQGDRFIQLWRLTTERGPDVASDGTEYRIGRVLESPRLDFSPSGSNRLELKKLEASDSWLSAVSGTVDVWLYYRPDEYPCWFFWKHWQICARVQRCSGDVLDASDVCLRGLNLKPQYRARIGSLRPPDSVMPDTGLPSRDAYAFQYRMETDGDCDVTAVRLLAVRLVEQTFGSPLPETASCEEVICCDEGDTTAGEEESEGDNGGEEGGNGNGNGGNGNGNGDGGGPTTDKTFPGLPSLDPVPFTCEGANTYGPMQIRDPATLALNYVGINPGAQTPEDYLASWPGCLDAWALAVWADFVATGIPFTLARLIWKDVHTGGLSWMAMEVYPALAGNYHGVIDLDTKLMVEYCPVLT